MAHRKQGKDRISDPRVDRIKEYLREKKMTLQKLVDLTNLSYPHVCNMMNGRKALTLDVLDRISTGLKLPIEYFLDSEENNDRKPLTRGGKQLMSEILSDIKNVLICAEKQNVDGIRRFFMDEPQRPLIAVGHGGRFSQAVYAALFYCTHQSIGKAVTCYSCNSISDSIIQNSKVLLVSKGMSNIDINYIAKRCIDLNPEFTCAIRFNGEKEDNAIIKKLDEKCRYSFQYDTKLEDGFISIRSAFMLMAMLYKAFTNDDNFVSKLELSHNIEVNFTYSSADGIATVPNLSKIKHFTVLYGSWAEPIAYNIESNIVESGIASCMISDYRNYTHGRFLTEGNYIKSKCHPSTDAAIICLVTPREEHVYEDLLDSMPSHLPVVAIRTDLLTPLATLDLLYKANMFVAHLGEQCYKTNPNDPTNFSGIDKRIPKNNVHFEKDFKVWGALDVKAEKELLKKTKRDLKVEINSLDELFQMRDDILEKEAQRTEICKRNWKASTPISWNDFSFRKIHEYDTQKQECWSFNSKTDVRDGISLRLGNMANGYGVEILGIQFPNSEIPYQLAIFKKDAIKIQEEIVDTNNGWLYNGLKMKRKFIYNREYAQYRRDTEFEGGKELWCFEWMKWLIWEKVKQNKDFADILLAIPQNAIIIEQAQKKQKDKPSMWGAWNDKLLRERKIVIRAAQIENGLGKTSKVVKDEIYKVNNVGKWQGENAMGEILTMAKLALNQGINLPVDADMLNDAKINWFGKVLQFRKQNDGLVTVKSL